MFGLLRRTSGLSQLASPCMDVSMFAAGMSHIDYISIARAAGVCIKCFKTAFRQGHCMGFLAEGIRGGKLLAVLSTSVAPGSISWSFTANLQSCFGQGDGW